MLCDRKRDRSLSGLFSSVPFCAECVPFQPGCHASGQSSRSDTLTPVDTRRPSCARAEQSGGRISAADPPGGQRHCAEIVEVV